MATNSSPSSNVAEYTVSEISQAVKRTVEGAFDHVRIRGELGRVSRPGSGHLYLDLKDEKAVLNGVIWKGVAAGLSIKPEQGLEVIVTGRLTTFPGQSRYQIVIETMEPAGVGALMALLEERKRKFTQEGLFDPARKQLLPFLPRTIGVVTSPTGAVIRDILHRLTDRFPVNVLVWPVRVQGEQSAREIARGIHGFNAFEFGGPFERPDVIVVARGGGSIEDLWSFNEEIVVRAAADGDIPLVSAVGHETDWTLIDYAADVRAPTPTAAAELCVPVRSDLLATVADLSRRHQLAMSRRFDDARVRIRAAERGLPKLSEILAIPRQQLDNLSERLPLAQRTHLASLRARMNEAAAAVRPGSVRQVTQEKRRQLLSIGARLSPDLITRHNTRRADALDNLGQRMTRAFGARIETSRAKLHRADSLLEALSHKNVLARGFALVRNADGELVRTASSPSLGDAIAIEFSDGSLNAQITSVFGGDTDAEKKPAKVAATKAKSKTKAAASPKKPDEQTSLFGD